MEVKEIYMKTVAALYIMHTGQSITPWVFPSIKVLQEIFNDNVYEDINWEVDTSTFKVVSKYITYLYYLF
jgi:hypothetical protein